MGAMAEYFVGPVMEKLIEACFKYLKDQQVSLKTGMEKELQKLREIHPTIQDVVSAYIQAQIEDPGLNKWLWQLRDAVVEVDDVLDEFEYTKQCANKKTQNVHSFTKLIKKKSIKLGKLTIKSSDTNLKRLGDAVHKLHEISTEVSTYLHRFHSTQQEQRQLELDEMRETGSVPTNNFLGRSKEIDYISQWLRNSHTTQSKYKTISLLSVAGDRGMGKTTLLQHVIYKDGVTKEFDVKMWVSVCANFDAIKVIKKILKSLKQENLITGTLQALQEQLSSEVRSKRFLLVLDDIWKDNEREWNNVLKPLSHGSLGSKILITTPSMDLVASTIVENSKKLEIKGLREKEFFQLFNTHAFVGVESLKDEFRSIVEEMIKKLAGCPIAAKFVGDNLNSNVDKSYWTNRNIEIVRSDQKHLLSILKLSYIYLPKSLKSCFAFCFRFPQDHEFDKNDLVRMWIALGLLQPQDMQRDILDTGRRYFNILVQKSFFHEFPTFDGRVYYKMSYLVYQLAQECFRVADDKELSNFRHLSMNTREASSQNMEKFKNLRSLFLSSEPAVPYDKKILSDILKASKNIRLLVISGWDLKMELLEEINCLIHLRYLKIESNRSFKLPRSISLLHHLQFIISDMLSDIEMDNMKELMPNENCQLILNKLVIKGPSATQLMMEPMRRISSIRFLTIGGNDKLVSFPSDGTEQWFLQHTSSLFRLEFQKLQSLKSLPSSLESFSSLNTLRVCDVPQLELLPNPPASLVTLELCNLKSLQRLPSSLSTSSSLTNLTLKNIPRLESLSDLPTSLINLYLEDLESLERLPSSLSTFSYLTRLKIKNIPRLESIPDLPTSLKEMEIKEVRCSIKVPGQTSRLN